MKTLIVALAIVVGVFGLVKASFAYSYVRGYTRSSGTYVSPHFRSSPNSYRFDNYSAHGNYNPFTGRKGYRAW